MNTTRFLGAAFAAAVLFAGLPSAHAWTKVKNNSANPIFVAYAHDANEGAGCGYDDRCPTSGFVVKGWTRVNPGGEVQVNSKPHHNAKHSVWAEDDFGHFWGGTSSNGRTLRLLVAPRQEFDRCEQNLPTQWPTRRFFNVSNSTCCGIFCSPVNHSIPFNP